MITEFLKKRHLRFKSLLENDSIPPYVYLYLNPSSYFLYRKRDDMLRKAFYRVDGTFATSVLNFFINKLSFNKYFGRESFDFTSFADPFFQYAQKKKLNLHFSGGTDKDIKKFVALINERYPELSIASFSSGYISDEHVFSSISSSADAVIIGLGNIRQETFALNYIDRINKPIFTCGAFISQISNSSNDTYFPDWSSRYNIRFLYRFVKEPYTIKRVLKYYPKFLIQIFIDFICKK